MCSGTWLWTKSVHTVRVEADRQQVEGGVEGVGPQVGRVDLGGERVQVDHAVEGVVVVLERHPVSQGPEVVAQGEVARGRDAGEDPCSWGAMVGRDQLRCRAGSGGGARRTRPVRYRRLGGLRGLHAGLRGSDRPLVAPGVLPRGRRPRHPAAARRRRLRQRPVRAARSDRLQPALRVPAGGGHPDRAEVPEAAARAARPSTTTRS